MEIIIDDNSEVFNVLSSSPANDNTGGPSLSSLGLSELCDNERERVEDDEEEEDDADVKGGCGHSFLKLCKQPGTPILGFVQEVVIRIKSKI